MSTIRQPSADQCARVAAGRARLGSRARPRSRRHEARPRRRRRRARTRAGRSRAGWLIRRTALAMFAFATSMIAPAASCRSTSRGSAICVRIASSAASRSSFESTAERDASQDGRARGWRRCSSVPSRPCRRPPGRGQLPADWGPLRSEPAASIVGQRAAAGADRQHLDRREARSGGRTRRTTRSSCGARRAWMSEMSVLVPPMSSPIAFSKPAGARGVAGGDCARGDAGRREPHRILLGRHRRS